MKRKTIILIHAVYWFYIINQSLFPVYVGKLESAGMVDSQYLKDIFISLMLNVFSFYVVYFIFPKISAIKNKLLLTVSALLSVFLITVIRLPVEWAFWKYAGHMNEKELALQWIWVWNNLRLVVITGIYAILIRFMINAFETQKLKSELINHKQAGELALLKLQINPHFLFNTLNSIYSLVYHKSDKAPEAVMKFSSIMRYVLFEITADKVPLEKEIEYLRSFIELQALRFKQPGFVSMEADGNAEGIHIAPMLLIPFVENAFKHGSKSHTPGILIRLHAGNGSVRFEITNYIRKTQPVTEKEYSGLGLSNIRRRLELIYPDAHQLNISEENEQFKVILIIEQKDEDKLHSR